MQQFGVVPCNCLQGNSLRLKNIFFRSAIQELNKATNIAFEVYKVHKLCVFFKGERIVSTEVAFREFNS